MSSHDVEPQLSEELRASSKRVSRLLYLAKESRHILAQSIKSGLPNCEPVQYGGPHGPVSFREAPTSSLTAVMRSLIAPKDNPKVAAEMIWRSSELGQKVQSVFDLQKDLVSQGTTSWPDHVPPTRHSALQWLAGDTAVSATSVDQGITQEDKLTTLNRSLNGIDERDFKAWLIKRVEEVEWCKRDRLWGSKLRTMSFPPSVTQRIGSRLYGRGSDPNKKLLGIFGQDLKKHLPDLTVRAADTSMQAGVGLYLMVKSCTAATLDLGTPTETTLRLLGEACATQYQAATESLIYSDKFPGREFMASELATRFLDSALKILPKQEETSKSNDAESQAASDHIKGTTFSTQGYTLLHSHLSDAVENAKVLRENGDIVFPAYKVILQCQRYSSRYPQRSGSRGRT